jgi:glycosidase
MLSNAMLFLLRGVPVVYSGDEQGFVGHGIDQDARQDLFASRVASYNDQALLGTSNTTSVANFNPQHPLYAQIVVLSKLRQSYPALRRGKQVVRGFGKTPGLFAVSRIGSDGRELVLAFNTSMDTVVAQIEVESGSKVFRTVRGGCAARASAPGSFRVEVPPLGYAVCEGGAQ